jgi:hypothetical protein
MDLGMAKNEKKKYKTGREDGDGDVDQCVHHPRANPFNLI